MPARSAEIAFILAAWSPTSLATFLAKSATRLAAMAARSAARFGSSAGLAGGFLAGGGVGRFGHFAPKNQTPAAKPTPNATHAQSKLTSRNVPMAAGRRNIVLVPRKPIAIRIYIGCAAPVGRHRKVVPTTVFAGVFSKK